MFEGIDAGSLFWTGIFGCMGLRLAGEVRQGGRSVEDFYSLRGFCFAVSMLLVCLRSSATDCFLLLMIHPEIRL